MWRGATVAGPDATGLIAQAIAKVSNAAPLGQAAAWSTYCDSIQRRMERADVATDLGALVWVIQPRPGAPCRTVATTDGRTGRGRGGRMWDRRRRGSCRFRRQRMLARALLAVSARAPRAAALVTTSQLKAALASFPTVGTCGAGAADRGGHGTQPNAADAHGAGPTWEARRKLCDDVGAAAPCERRQPWMWRSALSLLACPPSRRRCWRRWPRRR